MSDNLTQLAYALNDETVSEAGRWLSCEVIQPNGQHERHIIFVDAATDRRVAVIKFIPNDGLPVALEIAEV